jgi:glycosyltransferase involved in cell wall biosynthesis
LGLGQLKTLRALPAARQFLQFLAAQRVEVVQVHHADPTYFAVPLARLARVPRIVQTKYDVGYWLTGADLWLHRRLRRWIDATVANCDACRTASITQEGSPPDSVHVVQNGIPLQDLLSIPPLRAADWPSGPRVAMVANLRPIKDPETFLRAAHHVLLECPATSFHVAGEGPMYHGLQRLAAELGLGQRLRLHGHVADMTEFLAQTQLFVLSSRSEGLPHALLEAMAAGRAVIATRVGGNAELIEHEVSGLLVPPEDPVSLAQAILRLLREPQRAEQFGQLARQQVSQAYSLQAMSRRFEAFYAQLLGRTIGENDS